MTAEKTVEVGGGGDRKDGEGGGQHFKKGR